MLRKGTLRRQASLAVSVPLNFPVEGPLISVATGGLGSNPGGRRQALPWLVGKGSDRPGADVAPNAD